MRKLLAFFLLLSVSCAPGSPPKVAPLRVKLSGAAAEPEEVFASEKQKERREVEVSDVPDVVSGAKLSVGEAPKSGKARSLPAKFVKVSVENMPVTVAVDTRGDSIHTNGPAQWRGHFMGIAIQPPPV